MKGVGICRRCGDHFQRSNNNQSFCGTACRFWAKVQIGSHDECWPFIGTRPGEYGQFTLRIGPPARVPQAHRVAYALKHERDVDELPLIMHTCDNPPCCNPSHLKEGSKLLNAQDRDAKGRNVSHGGEGCGRSKLTRDDVLAIRTRHAGGQTVPSLAAQWGVAKSTIRAIVRGTSWREP